MAFYKCEICGGNSFTQLSGTFVLSENETTKTPIRPYGNIDLMVRICTQCGHISLFSNDFIEKAVWLQKALSALTKEAISKNI